MNRTRAATPPLDDAVSAAEVSLPSHGSGAAAAPHRRGVGYPHNAASPPKLQRESLTQVDLCQEPGVAYSELMGTIDKGMPMLSSYSVTCPHTNCGWTGNLIPSLLKGGDDAEIESMHRAWFHCPTCRNDWEVRITNDRVTVLPRAKDHVVPEAEEKSGRAIAFDLDKASLASLGEALPGWEIVSVAGATSESLAQYWEPGTADLLIVNTSQSASETLGLCRFLSFCTEYSTESREAGVESRVDAPLLLLIPADKQSLASSALRAGVRSCLVLPIHSKQVTSTLARLQQGNQPGRHTVNLEPAQIEDKWRDDGG